MNPESSVSPQTNGMLWYYADASNQPVGPLPIAGLEQLAAAEIIHARTKVIESGGTVWRRFVEIAAKPSSPQLARWFYANASNEPVGPLPFAELQRLAESGVISSKTQVVEDGGSEWRRFAEIAGEPIAANSREETSPQPPKANSPPYTSVRKFTILALGFVYPLGVLMLWRYSDFSKRTKTLVTSICSPIFLLGISGPGIIATPVALFLIWVWLGKTFSKVSQIALTVVCTLIFLPILLAQRQSMSNSPYAPVTANNSPYVAVPGSQATNSVSGNVREETHATNYDGKSSQAAGPSATPSQAITLGMSPERFRVAFNSLDLGTNFKIERFAVETGPASDALSYSFSGQLALVGSVNKASHEIGDLVIAASGNSTKTAVEMLVLPIAIIATVDPSISAERRNATVMKLYRDAIANKGVKHSEVLGTLKLGALANDLTGVVMFFVSPRAN